MGAFVCQAQIVSDIHLEIAAPGKDGYPIFPSGAIPLTVDIFYPVSPVKEVTYTCTIDRKRLYADKKMTQRTDRTWKDLVYISRESVGKPVTMLVTASFKNGRKATKSVSFTYPRRKPLTNLTENWNNLLNDAAHSGANIASVRPPLQMAWINNVGAPIGMTSPVIYKGRIFIASMSEDPKGKSFIYAIDGQSGDILWRFNVESSIRNSIAAADDLVFAQSEKGSVYAVNISDGSLKWGKQLHIGGYTTLTEGLIVDNGILYAGTGNGLCALNTRTGDRVWQSKEWQQEEASTATLTLGKGMLIGSAQGKGLYGNDARSGALMWRLEQGSIRRRAASTTIYDNQLYTISDQSLFIIDPLMGKIIVRKQFPFSVDVASTPLLTDTEIIFGTANYGLTAVDRETLDIKWQFQTAAIETSPVLAGGTVFFGTSDGVLYGVDRITGELLWTYVTGAPVRGSVAVSGNTLVAVDCGGNVYAFVTTP